MSRDSSEYVPGMETPLLITLDRNVSLHISMTCDDACEHRFSLINADDQGSSSRYITRQKAVEICRGYECKTIRKVGKILELNGDLLPLPVLLGIIQNENFLEEHVLPACLAYAVSVTLTGVTMFRQITFEGRLPTGEESKQSAMADVEEWNRRFGDFTPERVRAIMDEKGNELKRLAEFVPHFTPAPRP